MTAYGQGEGAQRQLQSEDRQERGEMETGLTGDGRAIRDKEMSPPWSCGPATVRDALRVRLAPGPADRCVGPIASGLSHPSSRSPSRAALSFPSVPSRGACYGDPKSVVLGGGLGLVPLLGAVIGARAEAGMGELACSEPPAGHKLGACFGPRRLRDCGR